MPPVVSCGCGHTACTMRECGVVRPVSAPQGCVARPSEAPTSFERFQRPPLTLSEHQVGAVMEGAKRVEPFLPPETLLVQAGHCRPRVLVPLLKCWEALRDHQQPRVHLTPLGLAFMKEQVTLPTTLLMPHGALGACPFSASIISWFRALTSA